MSFDDLVDLGHDANGLAKGDDDFLVMVDVPLGQYVGSAGILAALSLAVLTPLLADLVGADMEVPYFFSYAPKSACPRLVNPNGHIGIGNFLDLEIP